MKEASMPRTKRTAVKKPVYYPILELPALPPDQLEALSANIAVNGVIIPILVDSDGPRRGIIDGNYRKQISLEHGYDCPEIVHPGLEEDEKRTLARALNLARRQLNTDQKRQLIADQLREAAGRTDRWVSKMLGVHHVTVASVRRELESVGQIIQQDWRVGTDGKQYRGTRRRDYWAQRRNRPKAIVENPLDFHPTPEHVTQALIARERFRGVILEPASGDGAIIRVLRQAGYTVRGSDIVDGEDFLKTRKGVANVVTNPPYSDGLAEKFCRHALAIAKGKVAMLLPMWFLEGIQRYDLFVRNPLKAVYVFSRRPTFGEHQEYHAPFGAFWAVWDKGYRGTSRIEWVLD